MSDNSNISAASEHPILVVPWMWIGDFVRCHSVVRMLRKRFPHRPVDMLTTKLCAPLLEYMPGVRKGIVCDLPRGRLAFAEHKALAARLASEHYGSVLVMPSTWKSALAPYLAGIPERTGFIGELRFGLLNDIRTGEKRMARMIDRCGALAQPKGAAPPSDWPLPQIVVPNNEAAAWCASKGLPDGGKPIVAFAPGSVGTGKRWPVTHYAELAQQLTAQGIGVWVLGGPGETQMADEIVRAAGPAAHNLTSNDLRNAILAFKLASAAVSNDSGLMHVAAAIGTPTVAIFGPTSSYHWQPLNPLAAVIETLTDVPCRPCHAPVCRLGHHRCMVEIPASQVLPAVQRALATASGPDALRALRPTATS